MKNLFENLLSEIKSLRKYLILSVIFIALSYSTYLIFNDDIMSKLGIEDGFFEYLTAISFLFASIFFLLAFYRKRKIIYLLFFLIFFVGMGEEISWGQRIINFNTPEYFQKHNVQDEFTFHNLEAFNAENFALKDKTGFSKLLTINFLYKLFWLSYCVLLPLIFPFIKFIRTIIKKISLPVPPISIGMMFLLNWLVCRITLSFLLPEGRSAQYYDTTGEIYECGSAFLFMILGFLFLQIARNAKKEDLVSFDE